MIILISIIIIPTVDYHYIIILFIMIIMLLPLLGSQVPRDRTSGNSDFACSFEQFALCSWKLYSA